MCRGGGSQRCSAGWRLRPDSCGRPPRGRPAAIGMEAAPSPAAAWLLRGYSAGGSDDGPASGAVNSKATYCCSWRILEAMFRSVEAGDGDMRGCRYLEGFVAAISCLRPDLPAEILDLGITDWTMATLRCRSPSLGHHFGKKFCLEGSSRGAVLHLPLRRRHGAAGSRWWTCDDGRA